MNKYLVLFHDQWEPKQEVMDAWQARVARRRRSVRGQRHAAARLAWRSRASGFHVVII